MATEAMKVISYRVKMVRCESGERMPFLIDESGMPLFDATVFVLANLRSRNRAASTILNALHPIRLFYIFLALRKINLTERLSANRILALHEIEALTAMLRQASKREYEIPEDPTTSPSQRTSESLERFRKRSPIEAIRFISPEVYCYRLIVIREYVCWKASDVISRVEIPDAAREKLLKELQAFVSAICARIPTVQSSPGVKEGLSHSQVELLNRVIDPKSPENPWRDEFCRFRNYALISFLLAEGQRRGESLGIRIPHIDFRDGRLIIARQPDSDLDPRIYQPNVKTLAHDFAISEELQRRIDEYRKLRRTIPRARLHDFLFVSRTGDPLSLASINKLFVVLRKGFPSLPANFSPHTLRYTWNDYYSEEMDRLDVSDADEQDWRCRHMGWNPGSKEAARYSRRRIKRKVDEVSLSIQRTLLNLTTDEGTQS